MLTEIRKVRPESPKQFVLIKRKKIMKNKRNGVAQGTREGDREREGSRRE